MISTTEGRRRMTATLALVAATASLFLRPGPATASPDCTAVANAVSNCSFETGDFTDWTAVTNISPFCTSQAVMPAGFSCGFSFFSTSPIAGAYSTLNGFDGQGPGRFDLSQDITLPAEASLYLQYRAAWNMVDYSGSTQPRVFTVHIEPSGGGVPLASFQVLTAAAATKQLDTGTLAAHLNLSGFAGPHRLHFEWFVPENFTGPAQFELDNITVTDNCPGFANPAQVDTDGDGVADGCDLPHYVAYKVRAPKKDVGGAPIENELPKGWVITVNDVHLNDADADDPENFEVKKVKSLLTPAQKNTEPAPDLEGLHYLRYQMKSGKQSVAEPVGDKFARPAKHVKRVWQLENQFGTIAVVSKKVSALLLPANKDLDSTPLPPGDANHFVCYQVKVTKDITDQTPESKPGSGSGKFRKDMQAFFEDQLDDCEFDKDGGPSFFGSAAAGKCLFDLKKVKELCNPMDKTAVESPRDSTATITPSLATTPRSLLCYQAKLAGKFTDPAVSGLADAGAGEKVDPGQTKHTKRGVKTGNPIHTAPGNLFPKPMLVDTTGQELVCIPTDVTSVTPLAP